MNYKNQPKIELHLHLDCSLSYTAAKKINPVITPEQFKTNFIVPEKCNVLAEYIQKSDAEIELMQTRENLRLVTLDLMEQLKEDHVIYAEIRFAPLLHTSKGLTPYEVVEAVDQAISEGVKIYRLDASIILCTLRHYSEEQSMETVHLARKFKGTHVAGFDIAADEAGYPIDNHIKAFKFAKKNGIPCTAHAGEARGADSIWETLQNFKPARIGHGVRSIEDPKLLNYLKNNDIHLEICPTSNIQTNVFKNINNHSADQLYRYGISIGINTDGRTMSNVSLTDEYKLLEKTFNWTGEHFKKCNLEAIKHAFASKELKEKLRKKIEEAY